MVKRILIVDDNEDSRYSLRLILSDEYEIDECANGLDALERARESRPNCILLDVEMPEMDGLEVCRRLRADEATRSIPIILVTGHHRDTGSLVRGLAAGGDEYVTKPVSKQELRARIEAMLRIQDLQSKLEVLNAELETEVRRRTDELRRVYRTVPVGIYTLDAAGRVTSINRHLEHMLGYESGEVSGQLVIGEIFDENYDTLYWLDLCRREGSTSGEVIVRRKDGGLIPVFDERVVIVDHLGEHAGFTGYIQDLRHQQRMRQLLKEQEVQAGVGRLTSILMHEIANPISGVSQYLDAMRKRLDAGATIGADELRRGAEVMRDALHRTTEMIQHMRGLTRRTIRPLTGVDPHALLDDLHALLRHDLHRRRIAMTLEGDPGRYTIRGDAGRLSQVFLNLITNARDAMPDGGELNVAVFPRDADLAIRFADTGVGIPADDQEKIFELLYTTKGEQGTGYGLTISKDIVDEHGGRIEVESQPEKGSSFTVVLPLEVAAGGTE